MKIRMYEILKCEDNNGSYQFIWLTKHLDLFDKHIKSGVSKWLIYLSRTRGKLNVIRKRQIICIFDVQFLGSIWTSHSERGSEYNSHSRRCCLAYNIHINGCLIRSIFINLSVQMASSWP